MVKFDKFNKSLSYVCVVYNNRMGACVCVCVCVCVWVCVCACVCLSSYILNFINTEQVFSYMRSKAFIKLSSLLFYIVVILIQLNIVKFQLVIWVLISEQNNLVINIPIFEMQLKKHTTNLSFIVGAGLK